MASAFKKRGRWYVQFKDAHGRWQRQVCRADNKTKAKRLAEELERRAERQRLGLEAMPLEDGGGTLDEMLRWWLETFASGMASGASVSYLLRKHVIGSDLGRSTLAQVTPGDINELLQAKANAKALGPKSLNHLRGYLVSAFDAALESGRHVGGNPATAARRRKVPKRPPSYLKAGEVPPVITALAPRWRALFATAIYAGLRKGELFALRKTDVDLDARLLTVACSHERDTTKGAHGDVIPIAAELVPYLRQAVEASPSELVFPGDKGKRMRRDTDLVRVLHSAMARAGIVTGYLQVCRRRGCGEKMPTPDAEPRRCPKCNMKLWPKPQVRPIRFHDLRHYADLRIMPCTTLAASSAGHARLRYSA